MAAAKTTPTRQLIRKLRDDLQHLLESAPNLDPTSRDRALLNEEIHRSAVALNTLLAELDPVQRPTAVFDPGNPRTIGFFVALALTAQPRRPLAELKDFYGTGVYALYYTGKFRQYAPISRSETPIYIGMAVHEPTQPTPRYKKGTPLAARLNEHRKNIARASETLNVEDFDYRALVIQNGWEAPAENYLIRLFRPVWNKEMKVLYGFGKHGDSVDTRGNRRSPWDTLHSGRKWATGEKQRDAKSIQDISRLLATHFERHTIYKKFRDVLAAFIADLRQTD